MRWRFDANGRGSVISDAGVETDMKWQIAGDLLFVDDPRRTVSIRETVDRLWISLTGKNPNKTYALKVSVTGPDQVQFADPNGHRDFFLTRLSE
jgi:hypothetical protein